MSIFNINRPSENDVSVYVPDRFGFFSKTGTCTSYTERKYKERYLDLLLEYFNQWEEMKLPFGISLKNIEGNCIGMCFDVDSHKGENIEPAIATFTSLFAPLRYSLEESGKGVKFWILFDEYIPYEKLSLFLNYMHKTYKHETFPNDSYFIRLPGLYKDYTKFSKNKTNGELLDTLEKVTTFLESAKNPTETVLNFIQSFNLKPVEPVLKKISNKKIAEKTQMATGMDDFFNLIWEFAVGTKAVIGEKFSCPFHTDENPSAMIYKTDEGKPIFCCYSENCKMKSDKESVGRDALDILHYYLFGNVKLTKKSIIETRKFLDEYILKNIFKSFLIPDKKDLEINLIKVSEYVFENMGNHDVRRDENGVLYRYVEPIWEEIRDGKQIPNIVKNSVMRTVVDEFGHEGLYYLGVDKISSVAKLIDAALTSPKNSFEEAKWKIPFKNGILDVKRYLADDPNALTPIQKEDFITTTLNCEYNSTAQNLKFEETIRYFLPDEVVRENFLQYIGACLVPDLKISKILFCIGTGGNGKGTILSMISEIFGNKCSSVKFSYMDDKFATYDLYGSWINIDPDSVMSGITQKSIAIIKTCTGDGTIVIQKKFGQPFKYVPLAKFIVACNQIPALGDVNEAITRRFMGIPFTQKVPKNNYGGYWEEVLGGETGKSGIVNILLNRLKKFILNNKQFDMPETNNVRDSYCKETDPTYSYICSLFETDLNDPVKYPIANNKRLTDNELCNGVTVNQLFQDYILYLSQTVMNKNLIKGSCNTVVEFGRRFKEKIADVISKEYRELIQPHRFKNERGYIINVAIPKRTLQEEPPIGGFVDNL